MVTLEFIPYSEIEKLGSSDRIDRVIASVKKNKIVLLEGRLRKTEETELIRHTMEQIDSKFKGIELSVIYPDDDSDASAIFFRIKKNLLNYLLGDRLGMTIIGPASIVKEIKRDPNKIEVLMNESSKSKKKKSKN